jgi:hypothetical protein
MSPSTFTFCKSLKIILYKKKFLKHPSKKRPQNYTFMKKFGSEAWVLKKRAEQRLEAA